MSEASESHEIPRAVIRSPQQIATSRLRTRLWWLTALCAVLAIGLIVSSFRSQGKQITIRFLDGYGLKTGDTLRYRGIDLGAVTSVAIAPDLKSVDIRIQLAPGNERIAVEGSQFWIQRARLRLGQMTGLETVLGAKYVAVIPGELTAPPKNHFVGIETPLAITDGDSAEIRIRFPAGEGLEVGDPVRYRGIAVGEVTLVELNPELESITVGVRLVGASRELARAGTQFWIERPRLDLTEIRGLETLLGGRYIAMQPTSAASQRQSQFIGLAEPPPLLRRDGSLELELDAPRRLGLVRGAPITYRSLEVGRVSNVDLASDGASVKIGATIDAEYAELVRANSKWWVVGGVEFDASLRGVHLSIESLSAWIRGGVAFATPPSPGEHVVTGHRFVLEPEPQAEWLGWQPRIAVQVGRGVGGGELPRPVRVVASWSGSWLGLYRRRTIESWAVALDDGSLRVPASFFEAAAAAGDDVILELAGKAIPFEAQRASAPNLVTQMTVPVEVQLPVWPKANVSHAWTSKSVMLIVNPELSEPLAIDGTRLSEQEGRGIAIAPGVAIASALSGSPVVNSDSGQLVGLLTRTDNGWVIARIHQ